jgi:outer membrane protein
LGRKTDTLDARARLADVESRMEEARHNVRQTRQLLMEIIGERRDPLAPLKDDITLTSPKPEKVDDWLQGAYDGNLGAQIQRLQVEISKYAMEIQKAGHYPSVDLLGQYTDQELDGSIYSGSSEITTTEIMLQISIPIYQGGGVNSRVRQAAEDFFAEKERQDEVFRNIERELKIAFDGVSSAIRRIGYLEKGVQAQRQSVQAKKEGFRTGLYTGIILLDANRDLYFYLRNFSRARTDYLLNTLRLAKQSGSLSVIDLKKLNQLLTM